MSGQRKGYADIIALPHHVSRNHPPMPRADRAAQFAPFAALTGYEEAVQETARRTEEERELSESALEELDETVRLLQSEASPHVSVTWFVPDERKEGGSYETAEGEVRRIDPDRRLLILQDGTSIPLDEILMLSRE